MSPSSPPSVPARLLAVDVLRALAALVVVLHHIPFTASDLPTWLQFLLDIPCRLGRYGVEIFLVLSGFCIHLRVARALARGEGVQARWSSFWKRRFWRLYPPYLAAILFSLLIYYGLAGPSAYADFERIQSLPWDLLTHLALVHNLFENYCFGLGNGPFWTLGLEEQFYALYALFLILRRRCSLRCCVGISLVLSVAWQSGWSLVAGLEEGVGEPTLGLGPLQLGTWQRWPVGLWFTWILGAVAAEAYTGVLRLPDWCRQHRYALLFLVLGLACHGTTLQLLCPPHRPLRPALEPYLRLLSGCSAPAVALAAFIVLNRSIQLDAAGRFRSRGAGILAWLGTASYSLYLVHMPLIRLLVSWLPAGTTLAHWVLRLGVVFGVVLTAAVLFHWLIERHFLKQPERQSEAGRYPRLVPEMAKA